MTKETLDRGDFLRAWRGLERASRDHPIRAPYLILSKAAMKRYAAAIEECGPFFINGQKVEIIEAKPL
jgi:hypothetical protein